MTILDRVRCKGIMIIVNPVKGEKARALRERWVSHTGSLPSRVCYTNLTMGFKKRCRGLCQAANREHCLDDVSLGLNSMCPRAYGYIFFRWAMFPFLFAIYVYFCALIHTRASRSHLPCIFDPISLIVSTSIGCISSFCNQSCCISKPVLFFLLHHLSLLP